MPLTCIQTAPSGPIRLDATELRNDRWATIHRVRPRPLLACPECGGRLHAKQSHRGFRFFAHDQANRDCSLQGESDEHRHLKKLVAGLVRTQEGWTASIEAGPQDGDHGGWRVDVLASGPAERRIAFEIQLAPMTAAVGRERAALYGRDRVESVWLTPGNPQWAMKIPTLAFSSIKPITNAHLQEMRVVRGLYRLGDHGKLEPRGGNPPLNDALEKLLTGELETHVIVRDAGSKTVIAPASDVATTTRQVLPPGDEPPAEEQAPVSVAAAARESKELRRLGQDIDGAFHRARNRLAAAGNGRRAIDERKIGLAYAQTAAALLTQLQRQVERYAQQVNHAASMPAEWHSKEIRPGLTNRHMTQYYREELVAGRRQLAIARQELEAVRRLAGASQ